MTLRVSAGGKPDPPQKARGFRASVDFIDPPASGKTATATHTRTLLYTRRFSTRRETSARTRAKPNHIFMPCPAELLIIASNGVRRRRRCTGISVYDFVTL